MGKLTVSAFQEHETDKAATCIKIKSLTFDKILQRLKKPLLEDCPLLLLSCVSSTWTVRLQVLSGQRLVSLLRCWTLPLKQC